MCICLYMSNINFFYSNFFVLICMSQCRIILGLGWLCTSLAFEVQQSSITPGQKLCLQKARFSLCSFLSRATGLAWYDSVALHASQSPLWSIWIHVSRCRGVSLSVPSWTDMPRGVKPLTIHAQGGFLQVPCADESKPGSTPWSRQGSHTGGVRA